MARLIKTLMLLQSRYFPVLIGRTRRDLYLQAVDSAAQNEQYDLMYRMSLESAMRTADNYFEVLNTLNERDQ